MENRTCNPMDNGVSVAQELIEALCHMADRADSLRERAEERLSPILRNPEPCTAVGCDERSFPPLFEALRSNMDKIQASLDGLDDIINRCEL